MRDLEHIYMNIPRWTGRIIEEGTPWLEAAAEAESALSQLDSLLGEFGGIGFVSQMGALSSVTDGINAMRDARKYLHGDIVRLVDKPLEECFTRAVEALAAIDFDKIRVENHAGLVVHHADVGGKGATTREVNDYSLSDVLKGNVPELNGCNGYNQKIEGIRELLEEIGGFTLEKLEGGESDDEKTKDKKGFFEGIEDGIEDMMAYQDWGRANDPTGRPTTESVLEYVGNITIDIIERSKDKGILERIHRLDNVTDIHKKCVKDINHDKNVVDTANLGVEERKEYIWNYLLGELEGVTEMHVAAIAGNMQQESQFSPLNLQDTRDNRDIDDPEYIEIYDVDDNRGWGLIQWTHYSRKQGLLNYADKKGTSVGDLDTQLEFLKYEVTEGEFKGKFQEFLQITDLEEAVMFFCDNIEKAGKKERDNRIQYAEDALEKFGTD